METNLSSLQQQGLNRNNTNNSTLNQSSNDDNELYSLALLTGVQMEYSTFKYETKIQNRTKILFFINYLFIKSNPRLA